MIKTKDQLVKILAELKRLRAQPPTSPEIKNALKDNRELIDELIEKSTTFGRDQKRPNFPISNSNIFEVKKFIQTLTQDTPAGVQSFFLQLLWSKIRYFQNLLVFENDEYLETYGHRLFQAAILGGVAAVIKHPFPDRITYDDNKLIVNVAVLKTDLNMNPTEVNLLPTIWVGPTSIGVPDPAYEAILSRQKVVKWNDKRFEPCFLKWESTGISYLLMLVPFINAIETIFKMLQVNIPAGMHRWIIALNKKQPPTQAIREELTQMLYNRFSPIIYKTNNLDYTISGLPRQSDVPPNEYTRQDCAWFMNLASYITGEFTNLSEKNERNINAEVTVNTSYFHITQQEFLKEAKIFVRRYNKVHGANATVRFVYDLEQHQDGFEPEGTSASDTDNQSPSPLD